jgi:D-tyrosyl-tRNA(Tyr) deacylase
MPTEAGAPPVGYKYSMIALIQRVSSARVDVDGETVGRIGTGLLALIGVRPDDDEASGARLLERLLTYRVFPDEADRMNRSLVEVGGGLLLVPQFTLAADTRRGTRPGFSTAAPPAQAAALFERLVAAAREQHREVATGRFGANMRVALVNDGPVTFWLES